MESKRIAHLPVTPVVFEGVSYNLCSSFEELIRAQEFFNSHGYQLDLAASIFNAKNPQSALAGLRVLLPCALRTFHPELSYGAVQHLIDRTVERDDPAFIKAVQRMWPVHDPASKEIMAQFWERLSDEWKQQFFLQVIAERWPGVVQA